MKMSPSGRVHIGYNPGSGGMMNQESLLKIQSEGNSFENGCNVNMPGEAFGDGVRVEYEKYGCIYPFTAYRNGWKIFHVDDLGCVLANGYGSLSDLLLKENIESIANPLDKVMQLQGLSFDMIFPEQNDDKESLPIDTIFARSKKRTPELTREIFDQIQKEKSRKRMGVIAQDVEKMLPELVRTREDGLKAVFYPEMVAVLIEAIKAQQAQIEKQQAQIEELQAAVFPGNLRSESFNEETSSIDEPNEAITECRLFQNTPNPFTLMTEIRYFLPAGIAKAHLYIYDMQGKQIKSLPVAERGEGMVQIQGSELSAGMYIYTLIADNNVVGSKRMILTE